MKIFFFHSKAPAFDQPVLPPPLKGCEASGGGRDVGRRCVQAHGLLARAIREREEARAAPPPRVSLAV